jgi:hypothetical protein
VSEPFWKDQLVGVPEGSKRSKKFPQWISFIGSNRSRTRGNDVRITSSYLLPVVLSPPDPDLQSKLDKREGKARVKLPLTG